MYRFRPDCPSVRPLLHERTSNLPPYYILSFSLSLTLTLSSRGISILSPRSFLENRDTSRVFYHKYNFSFQVELQVELTPRLSKRRRTTRTQLRSPLRFRDGRNFHVVARKSARTRNSFVPRGKYECPGILRKFVNLPVFQRILSVR